MPVSFGSFLAGQEKNITAHHNCKNVYLPDKLFYLQKLKRKFEIFLDFSFLLSYDKRKTIGDDSYETA